MCCDRPYRSSARASGRRARLARKSIVTFGDILAISCMAGKMTLISTAALRDQTAKLDELTLRDILNELKPLPPM